jgi:hypothetical protein
VRSPSVVRFARLGHLAVTATFVALVVVQVFLAGLALFGSGGFRAHVAFGYSAVWVVVLLIPALAWLGRVPRRDLWLSVGLFALYIPQCLLPPLARAGGPEFIAALHPVNALLMFGLATWLTGRGWTRVRGSAGQSTAE